MDCEYDVITACPPCQKRDKARAQQKISITTEPVGAGKECPPEIEDCKIGYCPGKLSCDCSNNLFYYYIILYWIQNGFLVYLRPASDHVGRERHQRIKV